MRGHGAAAEATAVAVVGSTNKTRIIQALLDNVSRATSAWRTGCQYSRASSVTGNWNPSRRPVGESEVRSGWLT